LQLVSEFASADKRKNLTRPEFLANSSDSPHRSCAKGRSRSAPRLPAALAHGDRRARRCRRGRPLPAGPRPRGRTYDRAVLVSSDRDFIPAVEFLNAKGRKVLHAGFPPRGSDLAAKCRGSLDLRPYLRGLERT